MAKESTRAIRAAGIAIRRRCTYSATHPTVRVVVNDVRLASIVGVPIAVCIARIAHASGVGAALRGGARRIASTAVGTINPQVGLASVVGVSIAVVKSSMASEPTRAIRAAGIAIRRRCTYSATRPAVCAVVNDVRLASIVWVPIAVCKARIAHASGVGAALRGGARRIASTAVGTINPQVGLASVGRVSVAVFKTSMAGEPTSPGPRARGVAVGPIRTDLAGAATTPDCVDMEFE